MKPLPLALSACLLTSLTGCGHTVGAEKVNFGADGQKDVTRYLRDCASTPLPDSALRTSDDVVDAVTGDKGVDRQKSGCLEVGARHIENLQQEYGDR